MKKEQLLLKTFVGVGFFSSILLGFSSARIPPMYAALITYRALHPAWLRHSILKPATGIFSLQEGVNKRLQLYIHFNM